MTWSEAYGPQTSQMAGLLEGEISESLRVGFHVADDDVIHQFDFENLGSIPQNARHADVSPAWCRIAARVVMSHHDRGYCPVVRPLGMGES